MFKHCIYRLPLFLPSNTTLHSLCLRVQRQCFIEWIVYVSQLAWTLPSWHRVSLLFLWTKWTKSSYYLQRLDWHWRSLSVSSFFFIDLSLSFPACLSILLLFFDSHWFVSQYTQKRRSLGAFLPFNRLHFNSSINRKRPSRQEEVLDTCDTILSWGTWEEEFSSFSMPLSWQSQTSLRIQPLAVVIRLFSFFRWLEHKQSLSFSLLHFPCDCLLLVFVGKSASITL